VSRAWLVATALLLAGCGARVGDACRSHSECQDGLEFGYCAKAGFCTRPCGGATPTEPLSGATAEDTACPGDSVCARRGRRIVCLASCASSADCAPGLTCADGLCELVQPFVPAAAR
jgi:hypothetical protein